MPFAFSFSTKVWVLLGLSTASAAYLYYEYRCRRAEEQIIEYELAQLQSPDVYTQKNAIESVLERVSKNKNLLAMLCTTHEGHNLQLVKHLIHSSRDSETQFAAIELVCLISEDEKSLGKIRDTGLFQVLISVLAAPISVSDEIVEAILIAIRNCTKPTAKIVQNIVTGQVLNITADGTRDRNDDVYDRDDEWFSRELYQLHGFEPVVSRLASEDEDIQVLALEIITNYCKIWKNKEEIGELGGIGNISRILSASSNTEAKLIALTALRHCVHLCEFNKTQLRKANPISALLAFLQTAASGTNQVEQCYIIITVELLDVAVTDSACAAQIRKENMIPQLFEYLKSHNEELAEKAKSLLGHISRLDRGCQEEIKLRFRGGSGNIGVTPHRAT